MTATSTVRSYRPPRARAISSLRYVRAHGWAHNRLPFQLFLALSMKRDYDGFAQLARDGNEVIQIWQLGGGVTCFENGRCRAVLDSSGRTLQGDAKR